MRKAAYAVCIVMLAALFVLQGCSPGGPAASQTPLPSCVPLPTGETASFKAALYFLNPDKTLFATETANIEVGSGESRPEAALQALISGPKADFLPVMPRETQIEYVESSLDVINVYLKGDFDAFLPDDYMIARTAIANTLSELEGVSSINVYFNGIEPGYAGMPTGPAERYTSGITDLLSEAIKMKQDIDSGETAASTAVVYFRDARGQYLMPQPMAVQWGATGNIEAVIDILKNGPKGDTGLLPVLPSDIELLEPPSITGNNDGTKTAVLNFAGLPIIPDVQGTSAETLPYASLVYSITGNIPLIRDVIIKLNGKPVTEVTGMQFPANGQMKREDFIDLIGNYITLYFPNKEFTGLLAIQRSVPQRSAMDAAARIHELMRGPLYTENDDAWPLFPSGISSDDLLGVKISGDIAVVDLSMKFKERCVGLDASGENALVYAIVNSLTEIKGVKRVQFLFGGNPYETLSGYLCLTVPLMRNPGLIIPE
ncbi:MAG: GerMN domain-containing protein [Bacillota bacterium]|nr:GerMN domain-containing protein [Bacillota bacterium]